MSETKKSATRFYLGRRDNVRGSCYQVIDTENIHEEIWASGYDTACRLTHLLSAYYAGTRAGESIFKANAEAAKALICVQAACREVAQVLRSMQNNEEYAEEAMRANAGIWAEVMEQAGGTKAEGR